MDRHSPEGASGVAERTILVKSIIGKSSAVDSVEIKCLYCRFVWAVPVVKLRVIMPRCGTLKP
jgi:hypothetical protein